jgi:GTP-binding protein
MRVGAAGEDYIVRVPLGTEIREVIEEEEEEEEEKDFPLDKGVEDDLDIDAEFGKDFVLIEEECLEELDEDSSEAALGAALEAPNIKISKVPIEARSQDPLDAIDLNDVSDEPVVVVLGGRGGRGNYLFGHNNHECEGGQPGEVRVLEINLKTIADVGLVGHPNAGKSSFLAAVSNAHPKIASYPFTTINPYVGVIEFPDGGRISLADIPGLIEGAHRNRGLGHQFLKHIVKARMLVLMVDISLSEPWKDIKTLLTELELFQTGLSLNCRLIVANKADLVDGPTLFTRIDAIKQSIPNRLEILPISALHGLAITKITNRMRQIVKSASLDFINQT